MSNHTEPPTPDTTQGEMEEAMELLRHKQREDARWARQKAVLDWWTSMSKSMKDSTEAMQRAVDDAYSEGIEEGRRLERDEARKRGAEAQR